ncbi:FadR/GntR family transcriptional regulator [Pseudooceanicola nanhaiensis]|uniref:FadR/GntR family transcriptional regulator n=1 Tax=Pseudooceanicola nanhaiensis TaxID=375761 RepID=UPI001CD425AC|nr:FadR/GntR family transcriptional regulator [Pseudooceanicola nanhaiensis]MCA0922519.1 FadR family transcriptional regulator [Pseudooceanicola nanhaiensis]
MNQTTPLSSLKAYIADGNFAPGDRLPPERVLTEALGLKRATLRRALDTLEQEGVIWRHVGKGTFLAEERPADAPMPWFDEVSRQLTPVKMMRARMSIEPAIAREAAVNASKEALARIDAAILGAEEAPDWETYEEFDDQLHHAIAEATDNPLLVALFRQLNGVQRAVAWNSVVRTTERPPRSHTSFAEHRAIADAIRNRDPNGAHDAMRRHIGSVSGRLFGEI